MGQQPVDAVQRLVDVFDKQDDTCCIDLVRRAHGCSNHRQVAAQKAPMGDTRHDRRQGPANRMGKHHAGPVLAPEHVEEGGLGRW
ncbi:hypothetical protein D3C76_1082240 [compost metagenome]